MILNHQYPLIRHGNYRPLSPAKPKIVLFSGIGVISRKGAKTLS
jgi:hypothetical protein